jgi:hypothetical protein
VTPVTPNSLAPAPRGRGFFRKGVAPGVGTPGAEWSWGRDHLAVQSRTKPPGDHPQMIH